MPPGLSCDRFGQSIKRPGMPVTYQIDRDRRLVISTAWDTLTGADILAHQHKLQSDPSFNRDFFQLLDFCRVTEIHMDQTTVRHLAYLALYSDRSRRAFVAPNPLVYGLSRMFMAIHEGRGEEQMQVFTDRDEALRWLYDI